MATNAAGPAVPTAPDVLQESYLQFPRFGIGVVLGVLFKEIVDTFSAQHELWNDYAFFIQLIVVLIVLELWLVITIYHQDLKMDYPGELLFLDLLLLGLPFILLAHEVRIHPQHLPPALGLFAVLFLMLYARQSLFYRRATTGQSGDVGSA